MIGELHRRHDAAAVRAIVDLRPLFATPNAAAAILVQPDYAHRRAG
jgi:hypothetical protein